MQESMSPPGNVHAGRWGLNRIQWIFEAPNYQVGPVFLNKLGLQPLRLLLANLGRRQAVVRESDGDAAYKRDLSQSGFCVIENFLPADVLARVEEVYEAYRQAANVRRFENKEGTGITWYEGIISRSRDFKAEASIILEALGDNVRLLDLASFVLGKRIKGPLDLGYQTLHCPPHERDDRDLEGVMHADRHFPCVKAFFFLNDNRVENGAYVYWRGSHKFTRKRVKYEWELSVQRQRWIRDGSTDPKYGVFERRRPRLSDAAISDMGIVETPIEAPKNSLVISNNMGFHKRGVIQPGMTRKHIRILFYDYQAPLLGRLLKKVYKKWRDRERK